MYNCTNIQLYKCTTVQMYYCKNKQLYNCTTIQMYNCIYVQLYICNSTTVQMYNLNKISIDVRFRIQIIQTKILFPENFYFKFLGSRVRRNQSFVCYLTLKFKIQTTVFKSILYRVSHET